MRNFGKVVILSASIIAGTSAVSMSPVGIGKAEASTTIKFSKTTYQTTSNLTMRTSASTKYKSVITIPKGKVVTSTEKNGVWHNVSYTYKSQGKNITKTGWVNSSYLKEYYQYSSISKAYYFTKKTTNLYTTPDTKKKQAFTIASNNGFYSTQKVVNSAGQTWYRVFYNGQAVYVNSSDVTKNVFTSFSAIEYQANKETTLYASFGNAHKKLATIPKDTVLSSAKRIGDWYSVSYNGISGFIHISDFSKYNEVTEEKIADTTFVTTANVSLSKEANESSEVVAAIPDAKIVVATHKVSNGWFLVNYVGKKGYVPGSSLKQVKTGDPLTGRDGYQFIDLRTQSPVTAKQINDYIAKNFKSFGTTSALSGKGQAFIDAGQKYGVNALYLAAHAIHESAFGTSNISLGKNNLFGFGSYDATAFIASYRFTSVDFNIEYIARQMKATYLSPGNWRHKGAYLGFSTKDMQNKRLDANSEGMNFYYASDPNWGKGIARHMQGILPYDKAYYRSAAVNMDVPTLPALPEGSDIFPAEIQGIAKKDLLLDSSKGVNDAAWTLKKGETFTLLEKTMIIG